MRKFRTPFAAAILLALAASAFAGGFFIVLGNADANAEARAHNAVLTIKASGCGDPKDASITGTAIGILDGRRQSIPLKLIALSQPGMYAVTQQWPAKDRYVLQFVATDHDRVTSTLVAISAAGLERQTAKLAMAQPSPADITALLDGASTTTARK